MAERRQADIDGIEHDFDRDEHEDDVSAPEEADQAYAEKDRAQSQTSAYGHHQELVFLLATTTAPTMAARRMREAISNGRANSVKSAVPIEARLPGEAAPTVSGAPGAGAASRRCHARAAKANPAAALNGQ